jgi:hypothetical protein
VDLFPDARETPFEMTAPPRQERKGTIKAVKSMKSVSGSFLFARYSIEMLTGQP